MLRGGVIQTSRRTFAAAQGQVWPAWLTKERGAAVDVVVAESTNILFNLAMEEYIFERVEVTNPLLILCRNAPTIVIGKHQNFWKEGDMQRLEADGVELARRKSGGGAVYQDLGNSCFSFIHPDYDAGRTDFKTMNNQVLIDSLKTFGIGNAEASGRNDLVVDGKKVSGSAYKLKVGDPDGTGFLALHHGTMLLNLELGALSKYLTPNKKKLESKGIDSVVSRVMNLTEVAPEIDHELFCTALTDEFAEKWAPRPLNLTVLSEEHLRAIPELMEIYDGYSKWDWRFGSDPDFRHSLEHKFDWALVDVQIDVEGGKIVAGRVFSDCLVPAFIDALNAQLEAGTHTYDVAGVEKLLAAVAGEFNDDSFAAVRDIYIPELMAWLCRSI